MTLGDLVYKVSCYSVRRQHWFQQPINTLHRVNTRESGFVTHSDFNLPDAPAIPGLKFRRFRGEADYPAMVDVLNKSDEADSLDSTYSVEEIVRRFKYLINCDPYEDMLFAEVNGEVIGYSRVWWELKEGDTRIYYHHANVVPAWRGRGVRRCLLHFNENRLTQIAAAHPRDKSRYFESVAADTEVHWKSLLVSENYTPVRRYSDMVRPLSEDIPDFPLPEGIEVRPALPEHYWTIWRAADEAFRDEWDGTGVHDEELRQWMESPTFNPTLWQVAWDAVKNEVAGMVLNFIDEEENRKYSRKRGHTEYICVRRPYRGKGLAKALIARSFKILKEKGMTEAALGADMENPTGAFHLYTVLGYHSSQEFTAYRKPLDGFPVTNEMECDHE